MRFVLENPVPSPRQHIPTLPEAVDLVMTRVLAKNPEYRFESCTAFARALTQALLTVTPSASHAPLILFVSYRRTDQEPVTELARTFQSWGNRVWYDQEINGGKKWWQEILEQIRACEVFVVALTPDYLTSLPCRLEYEYASALNKRILPIEMSPVGEYRLLPKTLRETHIVPFDKKDALTLISRALQELEPSPALPSPLPPEPETPESELGRMSDLPYSDALGNEERQRYILSVLEDYLHSEEENDVQLSRRLLEVMRQRRHVLGVVQKRIERVLKETL